MVKTSQASKVVVTVLKQLTSYHKQKEHYTETSHQIEMKDKKLWGTYRIAQQ